MDDLLTLVAKYVGRVRQGCLSSEQLSMVCTTRVPTSPTLSPLIDGPKCFHPSHAGSVDMPQLRVPLAHVLFHVRESMIGYLYPN
jgi:hypothetical protein